MKNEKIITLQNPAIRGNGRLTDTKQWNNSNICSWNTPKTNMYLCKIIAIILYNCIAKKYCFQSFKLNTVHSGVNDHSIKKHSRIFFFGTLLIFFPLIWPKHLSANRTHTVHIPVDYFISEVKEKVFSLSYCDSKKGKVIVTFPQQ